MKKILEKFSDYYLIFCIYALIGWIYEVVYFLIVDHVFINRGVLFGPVLPIYGFGVLLLLVALHKFMSKKHPVSNMIYTSVSLFTIITFIYTTIIEYTTKPKIYRVDYFLENYGLELIIANIIGIVVINLIIQLSKSKKLKNINTNVVIVFLAIWIISTTVEFLSHYFIETYTHTLLWDYSKDFLNINRRVNWDASRNFAIGGTLLLYLVQPIIEKILKKTKAKTKEIIALVILIPMLIDFIVRVIL